MTRPAPVRRFDGFATRIALAATCLLPGCTEAPGKSWVKAEGREDVEPTRVAATRLSPVRIERYYRSSGTLTALRTADLVAMQVGVIERLEVDEGDDVRAGQPLARLDGRELSLQASADKLAADNLRRELERLQSAAHGTIATEEIDKQRYAVEEAIVSARLSDVQARQTVVRAPFDGTIVQRHVDEGNLATRSTPLFTLADLSRLELELHLPERDAAAVADDATAEITLADGSPFHAEIAQRAPIVDPLTGTVKFTLRTADYPKSAMPGAFARARILIEARDDAPSLPRSAVFDIEGQANVFVIHEGRAERREVRTGLQGETRVEVVEGLRPDEDVVLDGNAGITEGMPLRAAPAGPSPSAPVHES